MMTPRLHMGDVALLGLCSDENSSFMHGAAEAPAAIRGALHNGSSNLCSESGIDLAQERRFVDCGDRLIGPGQLAFLDIETCVQEILDQGALPLMLGGDHAVTYPVLCAIAQRHGPVNILHFDAHGDLYHEFDGNPLSHACPFARIMENGLAKRLVQVGIRTSNDHLRAQAERFRVEVHTMDQFDIDRFDANFHGATYISFDMDALDPAYAPGVSHHEPGGLSVREVLRILQAQKVPIVAADIVEYNPRRDIHDMTAAVAGKLVKEIAALMLTSNPATHDNLARSTPMVTR